MRNLPVAVALFLAAILTCVGSSAQDAQDAQVRLLRADDDLVLHLDSPQRVRAMFRVTNLGSVLGDDRGAGLREKLAAVLLPDEEHGAGMRALLLRLFDSDASFDVGVHLGDGDHPGDGADGVVVMTPGKGLDAEQFARDVDSALREQGVAIGTVSVDGTAYSTARIGDGEPSFTLPILRDGKLILVLGEHLDVAIARRMAPTKVGPWAGADAEWKGAAMGLHLDLGWVERSFTSGSSRKQSKAVSEAIGMDSLRQFRLLVRATGPTIEIDSKLAFDERGPRGVFAGLFTDHPQPPAFAGLVTGDAVDWFAGKFDLEALARAAFRIVAVYSMSSDDEGEPDVENIRVQSRQFFGIDIEKEFGALLAHEFFVGDAHAFVPTVPAPGEVLDGSPADSGFVFVAGARDAKAFAGSIRALCGSQIGNWIDLDGAAELRQGVELRGTEDLRVGWLEPTFVLAGGPEVDEVATRVALRAKAIRETEAAPLPQILERVRRRFPAGYQGCGVIDLGSVASVVLFQLDAASMFERSLPEPMQWKAFVDELRPPLHALELDKVAITAGYAEHAFTLRVHW